jgi:hypothetical protein
MKNMSKPHPLTDRLAIRELIDAYSHCADRRDAAGQVALFTQDAYVAVYEGEPDNHKPIQELHGRDQLIVGFGELRKYDVTMHFNGQSTITLDGDRATGETYCLAHHLWMEGGRRILMVMGIRYYDVILRQSDRWLFAERKLITDWVDRRPSTP